jgi:hypothetical protein
VSKSSRKASPEELPVEGVDWEEIFRSDENPGGQIDDPLAEYVLATPRAIAILNLCDCKEQLERCKDEPLRLAQAAKSSHLAMQAALTDALAGSASIGAYDDKYIGKWLAAHEASRTGERNMPPKGHVMSFSKLLDKAIRQPMPWSGQNLVVSEVEQEHLKKLEHVRHRIEHPHPESHFIEPVFVSQTLPVAARLTQRLLEECSHHDRAGELEEVAAMVLDIDRLCADIEKANK